MNHRVSLLALILSTLSMTAHGVAPSGHDDFNSLAESKPNWVGDPGPTLSVGNGLLQFSSTDTTGQQTIGGWQWNRFTSGNDWSFEATIAMPSGVLTGNDSVALGLQIVGTLPGDTPTTFSEYVFGDATDRQFVVSSDAGTTFTDAPQSVSAIRVEFQLTDPQAARGTLTAEFDTNGSAPTHSWTPLGTPLSGFAFTSQPVIFAFAQSEITTPIPTSAGFGVDSVDAVPEPSVYAFASVPLAALVALFCARRWRLLRRMPAK